ncbi:MAG: hypothetical protein OEZ39_01600 [Gammaproteobacteria bacterium]|nr:hypothetical protein [Gammaproteobacteria bacterium]MDH5650547.1 hypothetical protein [Gammaproteobacteria bacterium]
MNTLIGHVPQVTKKQSIGVPTTPRGRALYTLDWFLNGRPVLRRHDNPCLTVKNGLVC